MGKWLENARDWAISRNRFWGTSIPVWVCRECSFAESFGQVAKLEERSKTTINDLHRHFVDEIVLTCPQCKGSMHRTPEVLDCWFESGSMPYGQEHYPFENREKFDKAFPADFISEGLDQTRGWFYTLLVLSTALFEKSSFKNCIVSGLILAEDGQKMSKRLKNYPSPEKMIKLHGADAIRLYILNSGAIKAEDLKFSTQGLIDTVRGYLIPLWNVLKFFITYARLDKWQAEANYQKQLASLENPLDQWVISRLSSLTAKVNQGLENYLLSAAIAPLLGFIDDLTNWYLRRSRRRFWKSEQNADKNQAYLTTYHVLIELAKLLAPIIPFLSEYIYQQLKTAKDQASVHLCSYPKADHKLINKELEASMDLAISASKLGRSIRTKHNVKLRQPLSTVTVLSADAKVKKRLATVAFLIKDELNVGKFTVLGSESELVQYQAKPNLPILGRKYGKLIPAIKRALAAVPSAKIAGMLVNKDQPLSLNLDTVLEKNKTILLGLDELIIERKEKSGIVSSSDQNLTVFLDLSIGEELKLAGRAREVINRIQNLRKTKQFSVDDWINIKIWGADNLTNAITKHQALIKAECLGQTLKLMPGEPIATAVKYLIDDCEIAIEIEKVATYQPAAN